MTPLKMPDITPAQIIAVVGSIFGICVAAGLDISQDLQNSIIDLITILAPLLILGDAGIRHGRSRALINQPKGAVEEDAVPAKGRGITGRGPGA